MAQGYIDGVLQEVPDEDEAQVISILGSTVRAMRNILITETDWWANSDVIMTDEQRAYRQALRDIPQQEGFPTNIVWPTKP